MNYIAIADVINVKVGTKAEKRYVVCVYSGTDLLSQEPKINPIASGMYEESQIISTSLQNGVKPINFAIQNGRVIDCYGSFSRFNQKVKPLVILNEVVVKRNNEDATIGYRVLNYPQPNVVSNIQKLKLLKLCKEYTDRSIIPVQNAIYVPDNTSGKVAHIKSYPAGEFLKFYIERNANESKITVDNTPTDIPVEKVIQKKKMSEVFNPEQLGKIKEAKELGIEKYLMNPKLKDTQMEALIVTAKAGVDIKGIAREYFSPEHILLLGSQMKDGYSSVKYFLNPALSQRRILTLMEADILGLDLDIISNPDISDKEAEEIKVRLEQSLWSEVQTNYSSWS